VIPFSWSDENGALPITDERMTRFNISLEEGVDMVLYALEHSLAERSSCRRSLLRLTDVAEAIGPECTKPIVGIRPGEKLHEEMITESDSQNTVQNDRISLLFPCLWK